MYRSAFLVVAITCVDPTIAAPADAAARCAGLSDDTARLACYDTLFRVQITRSSDEASTSHERSPLHSTTAVHDATEEFGLNESQRARARGEPQPDEIATVTSKVASVYIVKSSDRVVLTLENGQVWQQIDSTWLPEIHQGDVLEIHRAAFGSFLARTMGGAAPFRVSRSR